MGTIRTVAETGSTNADLIAALAEGARLPEGEWLVADRQSAGRGRQGRRWSDGGGNFMGSTVVHLAPGDPPPASFAFAAGLAVHAAVAALLPDTTPLRLKWPNDLTYDDAKLAGILIERAGDALVVGIGVNLVAAPVIAGRETIAIAALTAAPDRDAFARALADEVNRERERWRGYGLEPLLRRWQGAAHARGTLLTVTPPGEGAISGHFAGLADDGGLQLRLADGASRVIRAGDVFFA